MTDVSVQSAALNGRTQVVVYFLVLQMLPEFDSLEQMPMQKADEA